VTEWSSTTQDGFIAASGWATAAPDPACHTRGGRDSDSICCIPFAMSRNAVFDPGRTAPVMCSDAIKFASAGTFDPKSGLL